MSFETEVEIQPFIGFSIVNVVVGVLLFLVAAFFLYKFFKTRQRPQQPVPVKPVFVPMPQNVKAAYIDKLEAVKQSFIENKLDSRLCSEQTSKILREYMSKAYNINISHVTLEELRRQGMSDVADVISLCYADEFPRVPYNKSIDAIEQAQRLIGGQRL